MTSVSEKHTETIVAFIRTQMDARICPSAGSAEIQQLNQAVGEILKTGTDRDFSLMGLLALRLVIDRVGSGIATERALNNLSQSGGQS